MWKRWVREGETSFIAWRIPLSEGVRYGDLLWVWWCGRRRVLRPALRGFRGWTAGKVARARGAERLVYLNSV